MQFNTQRKKTKLVSNSKNFKDCSEIEKGSNIKMFHTEKNRKYHGQFGIYLDGMGGAC